MLDNTINIHFNNYLGCHQKSYFHVIEPTQTAVKENISQVLVCECAWINSKLNSNLISCGWIILYKASKAIEPEINCNDY